MGFVLPRDGILGLLVRIQPIRTALTALTNQNSAVIASWRKRALIGSETFLSARTHPYSAGPDLIRPAITRQTEGAIGRMRSGPPG